MIRQGAAEVICMKQIISTISTFAIALSAIVCFAVPAQTMGVGTKTYKFVLNDAYVDDPRGVIHWPDVWELVRQSKPNFNVSGMGEDTFAKMQPGETLTVRGIFSPNNQTFEVMGTEPGGGRFAPAQHY
jgi:hypothetical protein